MPFLILVVKWSTPLFYAFPINRTGSGGSVIGAFDFKFTSDRFHRFHDRDLVTMSFRPEVSDLRSRRGPSNDLYVLDDLVSKSLALGR